MARRKRASMREGPLADLFRSTDESVAPEEVKVTATSNGAAPVEVAVEEPVQETPGPEPVPEPTPEPVPEPTPDPVPDPLPGPEPVPDPMPPEPVAEAISSTDPNFRPSDVKIGPDGAIYFSDWHNPIIGHMQHNLRDPNRNRTYGRVYRVTYDGRPLQQAAEDRRRSRSSKLLER